MMEQATKDTRLIAATQDQDEDNSEETLKMSSHCTSQSARRLTSLEGGRTIWHRKIWHQDNLAPRKK